MLPNGQQQISLNKDASVFSGGYQYPFTMSGQPIVMAPNGVPCLVQPVYNMKPTMQGNDLSATSRLPQPRQEKKQLKSFANFTSSGTKNADDMIRSIILDSKSLIDDVPTKSINKHATQMADNVNNNIVTTSLGYNFSGIQFPHNHYSILPQGMSLTQNSNPAPMAMETKIDDEDEFGDFVGVHLEVGKSPSTAEASHIHPPPLHVPNLVSPAQSFTPVTGISESVDELSLYGIQMPRWITNERHVPEIYNQVFNSVTRNGGIDTQLLHSELLKSGLPREVLGYLWELCNRRLKGTMDRCELFLMLAMISIYQNKMDCSSLYILTKCPQAPIPKLDVISKSKCSLENSYTPSRNNPNSAPLTPPPSKLSMAPSTVIPAQNHCNYFIGDFNNVNKTFEACPSVSDERHAECSWNYKESSEARRNNQQNNCPMECSNSDVRLIASENDDEFDDFKSAPGVIGISPPKKAISSSSIVTTPSPPLQPQTAPKKPPTLLSLASPALSNPPSSLYPSSSSSLSFSSNQDNQLITTELNSSFFGGTFPPLPTHQISPSSYHQNSPSPDIASGVGGDKYAVFRELQLAEKIPDGKHEDKEFGEFETSPEMLSSSTSFPTNIFTSHPVDFSAIPATLQTAANLPSIMGQHGSSQVKTSEEVGEDEFTEFASAPPMMQPLPPCYTDHIIRSERRNDISNVDPFRQDICSVANDSQHVHKVPCDWSDFLGLDGNNDVKFSEKMSKESNNDYDDDDFEDFISHESKNRNVKNTDCMTSSVESDNIFNYNAKMFATDAFAKVEHKLENLTNHEMNLNLELFCDGMSLHKRNDVDQTLRKERGQLTDCNTWNSLIGQPEDGCPYAVEKILHADDNISFRSLEFKVSKPLSSTQTPDDSQSTSSNTDLEKKSADNRSLSSLDLFHSNESNVATASSSNSLANNTTDPSPNFLFGSGKPLDAKEILNKMGGVIAADRYYDLTDHTQDSDSHNYQWTRCLKVVDKMVKQANEIFCDAVDSGAVVEMFKIEKGLLYFKGLAEMFLVAARISFQMKASSISSEELVKLQKSVDAEWKKLSDIIPGEISSMFLPSLTLTSLDCTDRTLQHLLVELSDLDAYKWSCGLCLLRVTDATPSSPTQTDVSSSSNRSGILLTSTDRLEYGGRSYHPQCANLWINCVDLTLPSLNIPELL